MALTDTTALATNTVRIAATVARTANLIGQELQNQSSLGRDVSPTSLLSASVVEIIAELACPTRTHLRTTFPGTRSCRSSLRAFRSTSRAVAPPRSTRK